MEGDRRDAQPGRDAISEPMPDSVIEWIIRLALFGLAVAAVWTVFGDDLTQLLVR